MAMTELDKQDLFGEIAGSVVARKFGNLKYIAYTHRVFIWCNFKQNKIMSNHSGIFLVLPRLGAWFRGMISIKQVSLNDVKRHIFASNCILTGNIL